MLAGRLALAAAVLVVMAVKALLDIREVLVVAAGLGMVVELAVLEEMEEQAQEAVAVVPVQAQEVLVVAEEMGKLEYGLGKE